MATQINPDGTVTEFKIGQEELTETVAVKLNKDGSVAKKKGKPKRDDIVRKSFCFAAPVTDYDALIADFGSCAKAGNALLALWHKTKGQQ